MDSLIAWLAQVPANIWVSGTIWWLFFGAASAYHWDYLFKTRSLPELEYPKHFRFGWLRMLERDQDMRIHGSGPFIWYLICTVVAYIACLITMDLCLGEQGGEYMFATALTGSLLYCAGIGALEAFQLLWRGSKRAWGWAKKGYHWLRSKLRLLHEQHERAEAEERRLNGEETLEQFRAVRDSIREMIGESSLLSLMREEIQRIVANEVPRLLALRRYLIENIPLVQAVVKDIGDGKGKVKAEQARSVGILAQLQKRLAEVEALIEKMLFTFEHYKPVIVEARAGLASEDTLAKEAMAQLAAFTDAVRESVNEATAAENGHNPPALVEAAPLPDAAAEGDLGMPTTQRRGEAVS